MPAFTDYAFYTANGGKLSEAAYSEMADEAHAEILSRTNGAALHAPEEMREAVKLCECALIDVMAAYSEAASLIPKGVGGVSNDGYSVSVDSAALQTGARERAATCARYLQWPVNLMCGWL